MDQSRPASTRRRAGPLRDDHARLAVLHAADDLLAERGFTGTTVEGIAQRAGVAKQTVYRWWPGKVEILLEGLLEGVAKHLTIHPDDADAGALDDYIERFTTFVDSEPDGRVLIALLAYAQLDPRAGSVLRERLLVPQRERERELAIRSGAADSDSSADRLLDRRLGAVLLRAMRDGVDTVDDGAPWPD